MRGVLSVLGEKRKLMVLSGDGDRERENLLKLYGNFDGMRFNQEPADKLAFVRDLQQTGQRVLMIGDGLNDASALLQSDVAIAVSEDVSSFSPACDAILDGAAFGKLDRLIDFTRSSMRIVYGSLVLSLLYNLAGLWFAVQGLLSPLLAAILMPLSSISVVIFSTTITRSLARRRGIL
jgi:Cu+-exporting ATPase